MIYLSIALLSFFQNVSFSMVGRARNRDNFYYHAIASIFSNGIWIVTLGAVIDSGFNVYTALIYIVGTVSGSLTGAKISMHIEKIIGANM